MSVQPLKINLFGACIIRGKNAESGEDYEIKGAKHKALFALLATAPMGQRTRAYLQDVLWGRACYDTGRQSLRRALSDIKRIMGSQYAELINITNTDIALDLSKVEFIGQPGGAEFLEGMDLKEERFNEWLINLRQNPGQIHSLYSIGNGLRQSKIIPYITVLPFQYIGSDPLQGVLGDWLAEEICRSLSRSNLLNVISHLSSRVFAKQAIDITNIRDGLGVDYCLTGNMRVINGEVIIDADFIDVRSGMIIWTRQFHGAEVDFLSHASEGIAIIVGSIGRSIMSEAVSYTKDRPLPELPDHQLLIAGASLIHRPDLSTFARAFDLLEEAVKRDQKAAETHAWLAKWYALSVFNGWSTDRAKDTQLALDCTARALDINPENAFCLTIDGFVHANLLQKLNVAEKRYDSAIEINPNESLSWLLRGALFAFRDEAHIAIEATNKACNLSPVDPFGAYYDSLTATAYLAAEQYDKALELADRSLAYNDRHLSTLRVKITALHFLDKHDEAVLAGQDLMRRAPKFKISDYVRGHPSSEYKTGQNVVKALEAAGIL